MLQLVLGPAGSGKTTLLYERIRALTSSGERVILLTPEQASFETEKQLYRLLGPRESLQVAVLSFTRLCEDVFRAHGGMAGTHLDDTAKLLLMSAALGEAGGSLRTYGRSVSSAEFAGTMCETVRELKSAGATPDRLYEAAQSGGISRQLEDKLYDLALIYELFQALVERGYDDPDDHSMRACRLIDQHGFFEGSHVFVDGFMAFMGGEWTLLERMASGARSMTVALCCRELSDAEAVGVFTSAALTARRLHELARRNHVDIAAPVKLRTQPRYQGAEVAALALSLPEARAVPCEQPDGTVVCYACEDVYDELETAGAYIWRLVREEGYRWREIAVITRGLDRYLSPLQAVFERYEIPYFADLRTDLETFPLVSGLMRALEAVIGGLDTAELLALAHSGLTGIDPIDAAALENYCFVWSVKGGQWTSPFGNNPDGMTEGFTDGQTRRLEQLNQTREQLMKPLLRLREGLRDCSGRSFAAAAFAYLEEIGAAERMLEMAARMPEAQAKRFLDLGAQVWDALVGLLDGFGGPLAEDQRPAARFLSLMRVCLSAMDVGMLPQTIDQVLVGMSDRIRPVEPRAVFVLGANEGDFPPWAQPGGVLSASEKEQLRACGVDLLRTPDQQALFEQYYVYFALTRASQRLWVSYPRRDAAGVLYEPAGVLRQIEQVTGRGTVSARGLAPLDRAANRRTAFDLMTRGFWQRTPDQLVLRAYFEREDAAQMRALEGYAGVRVHALATPETACRLFGQDLRLSPSRIESYHTCPFQYYCGAGLSLRARRKVEFNPLESGSLIHLVLERMVQKYDGAGLAEAAPAQLALEVSALVRAELAARIPELDSMPARFNYLFGKLVHMLVRLLSQLGGELAQSAFRPVAFELPIRAGAEIPPLELRAADGTRVLVEGVVDRVDEMVQDDRRYLRVVDYKSGGKEFRLSDVYQGLNMQMLLYLFTLCEGPVAGGALPAGVLYMPARDALITAERGTSAQEIQSQRMKKLRMQGLLLDDVRVLSGMERNLAGVYIPVKLKKDGSFDERASALATGPQMELVRRRIGELLSDMSCALHTGQIPALPADNGANDVCAWCDFHAICGFEQGDEVRSIAQADRARVLEWLKEEGQDGNAKLDTRTEGGD